MIMSEGDAMKRIVTYDIKTGNDYSRFYAFAEETNAERITESTYLFDTQLSQDAFAKKLKYCFNKGDNVAYISCNIKEGLFFIRIEK